VPSTAARAKGLPGRLLELSLGADAGNRPAPDFSALGVELKTIPLDGRGRPRESTFVSSIAFTEVEHLDWVRSRAYAKLSCVLWVPVEAGPRIPLHARRIGWAQPWSPTPAQEVQLRRDWEDLVQLIACGQLAHITAHLGKHLQIRPKAAHGLTRTTVTDEYGAPQRTLPLGFYLRPAFTGRLLADLRRSQHPDPTAPVPAVVLEPTTVDRAPHPRDPEPLDGLPAQAARRPVPNVRTCVKAAPGQVRVDTITLPDPQPGQILVRTELTTICGSDLHVYHGRERGLDAGTVMGHEFMGEVVDVGKDVTRIRKGDTVICPFTTNCGQCVPCRTGLTCRCAVGREVEG